MLYSARFRETTMKPLSRITALAVLLSPAWLSPPTGKSSAAPPEYPLRGAVTPDILRERGTLRYAISTDLMDRFNDPQDAGDFDYDLLSRFASDLGINVVQYRAGSDADAAQLLRSGRVDVALLPADFSGETKMVAGKACPEPSHADLDVRLAAFAWSDSPELARLLNGAARHVADFDFDEPFYRSYCFRDPTEAPAAPRPLPFARRIARYASLIAKYSEEVGLDWRLVAALISEESSFEERAVSAKGAQGLMQLMPGVSQELGVTDRSPAEANIHAGIVYLGRLAEQFAEARASDRVALVLASYILGPGHVIDAQRLARELGLSPDAWQRGLQETLPLLEDERFNVRTRLGFAHGRQAVEYVNRILGRYEQYRRQLDREPDLRASMERDAGSA